MERKPLNFIRDHWYPMRCGKVAMLLGSHPAVDIIDHCRLIWVTVNDDDPFSTALDGRCYPHEDVLDDIISDTPVVDPRLTNSETVPTT